MSDVRLIEGEALATLQTLEAGSVDCVVTDPPYGIDYRTVNGASPSEKHRSSRVVPWQPIVGDDRPRGEWLHPCLRALRDGGALYLCCRQDVEPEWRRLLAEAGFSFKQRLVWHKRAHGKGDLAGTYAMTCEDVLFVTKGRHLLSCRPSMLLDVGCVPTWKLRHHPHQKPVGLFRRLIAASTPPGGTVLDPFAGSGTTGIAALAEGRKAILVEREPAYCDVIRRRLADFDGPLFSPRKEGQCSLPFSP